MKKLKKITENLYTVFRCGMCAIYGIATSALCACASVYLHLFIISHLHGKRDIEESRAAAALSAHEEQQQQVVTIHYLIESTSKTLVRLRDRRQHMKCCDQSTVNSNFSYILLDFLVYYFEFCVCRVIIFC